MRPDASENSRINPSTMVRAAELLVASHISRLASRDAAKSLLSTLVSESSEECRIRSQLTMGGHLLKAGVARSIWETLSHTTGRLNRTERTMRKTRNALLGILTMMS